jgi:mannose-1-phosphate guanylyltransferase
VSKPSSCGNDNPRTFNCRPEDEHNRDAIVLAGGYATRLWPITLDRPKMFLPLGEETIIDLIFESLETDDRVEYVYISTNERFADACQLPHPTSLSLLTSLVEGGDCP